MQKIMFNDQYSLTQATLNERKTQTRRIIPNEKIIVRHWNPLFKRPHCYYKDFRGLCQLIDADTNKLITPKYGLGEFVAIAQSYSHVVDDIYNKVKAGNSQIERAGDWQMRNNITIGNKGWNNKMFVKADLMPRKIRITGIRAERLQDISDEDCIKEGIKQSYIGYYCEGIRCKDWERESHIETEDGCIWKLFPTPKDAYSVLIDKISGKGTWDSNPYVFAYEYELIK